ncbi:L-ascorbate oxidase-like [Pyrus ussuriensis x Pyrus communis]|uniref:L-ascorbate oxidase-like n=1 Tax=Pyrus ussuriensis x Pyrus communis TaxID=2448454 RepID=A0A5N5FG25_9ROSA|nr:L-ascorbate oxidase-like [Pyrus ussuriensis x Pyrus communis]
MPIVPGKTYRLRVASLTALSAFSPQFPNRADQDPSRNYWITTIVVGRNATTPPSLGIFNYYPNHPRRSPPSARQGFIHAPSATSDRVIWSVNNVSFTHPCTPYLIALKENLTDEFDQTPPPKGYDFVNYDIYIVQNNTNATTSNGVYRLKFNSTTHLWYFHGHDFWVLVYGEGKFDMLNDPKKYNLVNPIMKNTVPVPGRQSRAWAFHCHIESHFYMGMGVVFESGIDKVGKLPSSIMGCGETRGFH